MPELPEVETVMRGLEPVMAGAKFLRVEQRRENLRFPFPDDFVGRLEGAKITSLARRAKYILVTLSTGEVLILHLGMSGRFSVITGDDAEGDAPPLNPKHDHVVFHLSSGVEVRYNDPRRFGFMDLAEGSEILSHKFFKDLGPEPLGNEFDEVMLAKKAALKKTPIKSFLLDQRVVAGLGNIYVLEALFAVGIDPRRPASILATKAGSPRKVTGELVRAVRDVLGKAIAAGGSTLKDYAKADGSMGYFQHSFQVYGREGEACMRSSCNGDIERIVQAGRSSFYCPKCQK